MKIVLRLLIPLLIVAIGWFVMRGFVENKKEPVGKHREEPTLPKVRAVELRRSDYGVTITSNGVVRAHNSTSLTPRVTGRIQEIYPRFEDGAFFKANDVLVQLDPTDFDAALAAAEAGVARAEAALAQEEARAEQALLDWKDLGYENEVPSDLVRRKPQLKEAEANLAAAVADRTAEQRNLERSKVLAPYDGCVLHRAVGPGQSVSSGTTLGEVFSTDFAEIRLPLSTEDLAFFQLPEAAPRTPIGATFFDALDSESERSWQGTVVRTEGILNATSRELFVIARVEDPYGLKSGREALRIGQPVRAQLDGRVLKSVFVLPRAGLRGPKEVVLVNPEDFTIQRTPIEPVWIDAQHVVVRDDLPEGWLLVVSQLSYAANGSKVEVLGNSEVQEIKAAQGPGKSSAEPGG